MPFEEGTFTIEISSDLDYEGMVINLCFGSDTFAILNCDQGIDKSEIRILDRYIEDKILWSFNYQNFFKNLQKGFYKLKEININYQSENREIVIEEFSIEASHNMDYENQVVYLNYGDTEFAILNCDKGIDITEIGFFNDFNDDLVWNFDYHAFMDILPKAFERLIEVNSNPLA